MLSFLRPGPVISSKARYIFERKTQNFIKTGLRTFYVGHSKLKLSADVYNHFITQPPPEICFLPNGLTVATLPRATRNVCVGLFLCAGPLYEDGPNNGIAHFFEHLLYKGSMRCTFAGIESRMNVLGAHFKSFTYRELVGYYAECLSEDVFEVMDIISECIYYNSYDEEAINNAKMAFYDELVHRSSNTDAQVYDLLIGAAFQGTPLEKSVYGPYTNLENFKPELISTYNVKCFHPSRAVLAASGGVTHEQMIELANSLLSCCSSDVLCHEPSTYRYTGSVVTYRDDRLPMANTAVAVEAPSFHHPDYYPLKVASELVGGWDRTQCGTQDHPCIAAQALSCASGAAAYKSFYITFRNTGLWGVKYMCPSIDMEKILYVIQDQWMHLTTSVQDTELEKAKSQLIRKVLRKAESLERSMIHMVRWAMYAKYVPPYQDTLHEIEAIGSRDVIRVAEAYVYDKCPAVASVGPTEGLPEYTRIRSGMYWLRY